MIPLWTARGLDLAFQSAWQASLGGALLMTLVWVLQRLFSAKLGVRGCYWLSVLVLARLLWPVPPASQWSLLNLATRFRPPVERSVLADTGVLKVIATSGRAGSEPISSPLVSGLPAAGPRPGTVAWRTVFETVWLTGVIGLLAAVALRHWRFACWLRRQEEGADPKLRDVLLGAQALLGVRARVRLTLAERGATPALFGWWTPSVLLPKPVLASLTPGELRMVLLHEVAHVKRGDVLLNWLMILVQSVHWFNPLVWVFLRRLRADRELVCDAMVLGALKSEEHRQYGATLIKLLNLFSSSFICPSLVPVVHHRSEIKKRIIMIPKFAPSGRTALALSVLLLAVLCALTFTRAAEQGKKAPATTAESNAAKPGEATAGARDPVESLKARFAELEVRIRAQQQTVDQLRIDLAIPSDLADGQARSLSDPETIRLAERERITAEALAARYQTLLNELKSRKPSQLAQSVPTAIPDTELIQLLRELNSAETQRARLTQSFGPENTEVKSAESTIKTVKQQINARVEGILDGLSAQLAAQRASADHFKKQAIELAHRDAELTVKYRPYFQAKRDLAILEKVRDSLMLQLVQRQFGPREDAPESPR